MDILFTIAIVLFGTVMGSFAGAQIWRLRACQLSDDFKYEKDLRKKHKLTDQENDDLKEIHAENTAAKAEREKLSRLLKHKVRDDRSQCLSCKHELAWYDLIHVVSWISLGGKCRYCRVKIGWTEILLEIGMAALFAVSVWWWSAFDVIGIAQLVLWLISLVLLAILFVYDARWFLLPDKINWAFIAVGAIFAGLELYQSVDIVASVASLIGSVGVLSGIYLILHIISKGKWIGFGDVKLGLGLGLFLGDWLMALLALFLANLIGTLMVLPGMIRGTLKKDTHVPFGPLLIIGFLTTWFVGEKILSWYLLFI